MTEFTAIYESKELFPLFANRLLSKDRPEYSNFLEWLNIPIGEDEPLVMLARTGGIRGTDTLTVFPEPAPKEDGMYHLEFFSHGIRYLPQEVVKLIETLEQGTRLYLMFDVQNEVDLTAIALRAEGPTVLVGYVPRFYTEDLRYLLHSSAGESLTVFVERVNVDAPFQLRLLCSLRSEWPRDFRPCAGDLYQPIPELDGVVSKIEESTERQV